VRTSGRIPTLCPVPCRVREFSPQKHWTPRHPRLRTKNCPSATPTHFAPRAINKSKPQRKIRPPRHAIPSRSTRKRPALSTPRRAGEGTALLLKRVTRNRQSSSQYPAFSRPHENRGYLIFRALGFKRIACGIPSFTNAAALESRASNCPIPSHSAPKSMGQAVGVFSVFSIT
jgi:hypothetical protein